MLQRSQISQVSPSLQVSTSPHDNAIDSVSLILALRFREEAPTSNRIFQVADTQMAELQRLIGQRIRFKLPTFLGALKKERKIDNMDAMVEAFCYHVGIAVLKEERDKIQLSHVEVSQLDAAREAVELSSANQELKYPDLAVQEPREEPSSEIPGSTTENLQGRLQAPGNEISETAKNHSSDQK